MTLVELTESFMKWLEAQPGVTSVGKVPPGPYQPEVLGQETIGFYLDGLPLSVDFTYE